MRPHGYICGCYYILPPLSQWQPTRRQYIAQVGVKAHTSILASTSRTKLTQTFVNPSSEKGIRELSYSFPLYDGVSVVGFTCRIGDRVIVGEVKEKDRAKQDYTEAKERGETAGLLEQLPNASDVFITKLGNVPPGATVVVDITYLGELKHDAEVDGIRFTIPTFISPRYGSYPSALDEGSTTSAKASGFEVTVDAELEDGAYIREMRSPSHPIAISLGTISTATSADPSPNKASATLSLGTAELDKDFVLQVVAKETAIPKAMLETHPTIPGHRALMATLVPKFSLPAERPEIVFVCDRSGSMMGKRIDALKKALIVFLKSLPVGVKFNICSFGSHFSFLWKQSKSYSQDSLEEAIKHVNIMDANFGGTEMYQPLEATMKQRFKDMTLEIFLVTDGDIWQPERLYDLFNQEIQVKKNPIRVFTLGIGDGHSSTLIEGVARAGNGFAQSVGDNEKLDGKVVRMLKASLSPHVNDYRLEVKYEDGSTESVTENFKLEIADSPTSKSSVKSKVISLFDTSSNPDKEEPKPKDEDGQEKYSHLPSFDIPHLLQAPHKIPPLFPFSRTTAYLLLSPTSPQRTPSAVVLKGTSKHGPLELEIPVQVLQKSGETIHQLAAKKAVQELEENRGWLTTATDTQSGKPMKEKYEGRFSDMVEREAVRLGVQFQVGGKWCSFVAVEKKDKEGDDKMVEDPDWEMLDDEVQKMNLAEADYIEDASHNAASQAPRSRKFKTSTSSSTARFARAQPPSMSRAIPMAAFGAPPPPAPRGGPAFGSSMGTPALMSSSSNSLMGASGFNQRLSLQSASINAVTERGESLDSLGSKSEGLAESANMFRRMASRPAPPHNAAADPSTFDARTLATWVPEMADASQVEEDDGDMGYGVFDFDSESVNVMADKGAMASASAKSAGTGNALEDIIALQTFEGLWELTQQLCGIMRVDFGSMSSQAKAQSVDAKVLATALAVHFLTSKLAADKESWELVVEKAKGWLEDQGAQEDGPAFKIAESVIGH